MYHNEFETKGIKISTKFKIEPQPQHTISQTIPIYVFQPMHFIKLMQILSLKVQWLTNSSWDPPLT